MYHNCCKTNENRINITAIGFLLKGVPPADENGDIGISDRVGQDESVGTN